MIDTHLISVALTTAGICVAAAFVLAAAIITIGAVMQRRRTPATPSGHATTTLAHEALTDPALPEPAARVPALR